MRDVAQAAEAMANRHETKEKDSEGGRWRSRMGGDDG